MSCFSGAHGVPHALTDLLCACTLIWAVMPTFALGADLQQLLADGRVPGVSIAVVRNGEVAEPMTAGTRNVSTGASVEGDTIFEAASLSKPVFAYAVLQLVDEGALSLDTRLSVHVSGNVPDDPRAAEITVRMSSAIPPGCRIGAARSIP